MENPRWIIVAIISTVIKESVSALLRYAAKHAPTVKSRIATLVVTRRRLIDGILDLLQSGFQAWFAWFGSGAPEQRHQMFFVAFFMVVAAYYFHSGVEKVARETHG